MKHLPILLFSAILFLIAGCSHTNELAKYDINGKGMLFNEFVSSEARRITIVTQESYNPDKKKDESAGFLNVLASISSDILSSETQRSLEKSVKTEHLVASVTDGLADALKSYLNVKPVESLEDEPQFITSVVLDACSLIVSENGVSVRVRAEAKIVDRQTGNIVWDNWESQTIPINQNYGNKNDSRTVEKIFNAVQLAALSEDEVNKVVGNAADDVGFLMAETLRNDVSKSKK